jgi:hypothetical protein
MEPAKMYPTAARIIRAGTSFEPFERMANPISIKFINVKTHLQFTRQKH